MEDHARKRLALFGQLCMSVGAATQVLGETLAGLDAAAALAADQRMRTLLLEAAATCRELAQYSVDTANLNPGYDADDATAMALLFRLLDHLGSVVTDISRLRLFDLAGSKFETWTDVAAHLRDAAGAVDHLGRYHAERMSQEMARQA